MAKNIEQLQAFINTNPDLRQAVNELADYLQANPPGETDPGYKEYVALLTQTGTNAPVPTVLANTLGVVPTYEYSGEVGLYMCHLGAAMSHGKVFVTGSISGVRFLHEGSTFPHMSFLLGEAPHDYITIQTGTIDIVGVQMLFANDLMGTGNEKTSILIRVYP